MRIKYFLFLILLFFSRNIYAQECKYWDDIQKDAIDLNANFLKISKDISNSCNIKILNLFSNKEICFTLQTKKQKLENTYFKLQDYQRKILKIKTILKKIEKDCNEKNKKIARIKKAEMQEFELIELQKIVKKYMNCQENYKLIIKGACQIDSI